MKKVLALIFALIFALSAFTAAFAASSDDVYECPHCKAEIIGEAAFNKHLDKTCPVVGTDAKIEDGEVIYICPYGCGAKFRIEKEYYNHLDVCFSKKDPSFAQKVEDFIVNFNFDEALETVDGLLSKVDFGSILVTIIDLLEKGVMAIIGAI